MHFISKKGRVKVVLLIALVVICNVAEAQDGRILSKTPFLLDSGVFKEFARYNVQFSSKLKQIDFYRIIYISDGLKVTAYVAEPKAKGKYPCIISNRGGNRELGQWDTVALAYNLGRMASWDYVVIATQYRGNDGGEGKEDLGGKDLDDVLNLVPVLAQWPDADTSRIGIEGTSRGGMMTYLALRSSCRFKAAVVNSGLANVFTQIKNRPDMDTFVFAELIPDYQTNKTAALKARSAVYWADQICKTTPLLILQGSSDWRVTAAEALELVQKLYEAKHPTRFILYEGASHGIREFAAQYFEETRRHFDYYLRDGKPMPDMELHGK